MPVILNCGFLHGSVLEFIFFATENDLPQTLSEACSYLYTRNTCISYKYKYFEKIKAALNKELSSICYRFCRK